MNPPKAYPMEAIGLPSFPPSIPAAPPMNWPNMLVELPVVDEPVPMAPPAISPKVDDQVLAASGP